MATATSILLVHFNPNDLAHLRRLLDASVAPGRPAASVAVAPDVTAALAAVRRQAPDAVLLKLDQPPVPTSPGAHALRELAAQAPLIALVDQVDAVLSAATAELDVHECLALPLLDASTLGMAIRFACERKRLHAELHASHSDLHLFAYTVAHDLKNQVFAAAGNADLLLADAGPDLTADTREMLADIYAASQRMTGIIQDLLLLSHLHAHTVTPAPLDMEAVLNEVRTRVATETALPPDLVVCDAPGAWPLALGYAPWVEEVWVRLIATLAGDRAFTATTPLVELGAQAEPDHQVRFWARGPGAGLAGVPGTDAFAEPGRGGERAGRSLALALVRRLVTRLGGAVHADGTPNALVTLSFTLPAAAPAP